MTLKLFLTGVVLVLVLLFLVWAARASRRPHWNRVQRARWDRWQDQIAQAKKVQE